MIATVAALTLAIAAAAVAYLALQGSWSPGISKFIIWLVDIYLAASLVEIALRSGKPRKADGSPKDAVLFALPGHLVSLAIMPLLLVAIVMAFGSLYLAEPCGVVHTVPETQSRYNAPRLSTQTCITGERAEPLEGNLNAVYFSAVTIMTVGYGDFVPANPRTRILAEWEFATGLLLLAGAFPLVISRLADY